MIEYRYAREMDEADPLIPLCQEIAWGAEMVERGGLTPAGVERLRERMRELDAMMTAADARDNATLAPWEELYRRVRPWEDLAYMDLWDHFPDLI